MNLACVIHFINWKLNMIALPWQLTDPIHAVIFDCDGTLSKIEGIDELATNNDVSHIVQGLTQDVMGKSGMRSDIYEKRLQLVNPTHEQIIDLGEKYIQHRISDALDVINLLKSLNKPVYIISAGIFQAVAIFAKWLGIEEDHVYAVNITFDKNGRYLDFDQQSSLINRKGKQTIVNSLNNHHTRLGYIGDGLNDYEVYDLVTRFIGYGGAYYRSNIAELCKFYVKTASLAPILPLLLTQTEYHQLNKPYQSLYDKGLEAIMNNQVLINHILDG